MLGRFPAGMTKLDVIKGKIQHSVHLWRPRQQQTADLDAKSKKTGEAHTRLRRFLFQK